MSRLWPGIQKYRKTGEELHPRVTYQKQKGLPKLNLKELS
jgi:hypothetical protein